MTKPEQIEISGCNTRPDLQITDNWPWTIYRATVICLTSPIETRIYLAGEGSGRHWPCYNVSCPHHDSAG